MEPRVALLWVVPRGAGFGAEIGAWDAAGVPGPALGPGSPKFACCPSGPPHPLLLAPLVAWGRAAPAPRAHCGLQGFDEHQLCSPSLGVANLASWGCSFPPGAFAFPSWC